MTKDLKDYLHLYMGCDCVYGKNQYLPEIGSCNATDTIKLSSSTLGNFLHVQNGICSDIKPLLRPLSSMTEEIEHAGKKFIPLKVLAGMAGTCGAEDWIIVDKYTVEHITAKGCTFEVTDSCDLIMRRSEKWKDFEVCSQQIRMFKNLLEWHFDLFGLIESGLALPINSLQPTHP